MRSSDDPPAEPSASVREQVLRAALRLFAAQGVAKSGMREIARHAGVSLGALQHYFPAKADLERAVMSEVMQRYQAQEAEVDVFGEVDFRRFIRVGLGNYLAFARANPDVAALGARLAVEHPDHAFPGEQETNQRLLDRIRAAQQAGELRDADPHLLVALMEVVLNGWTAYAAHYARHLPHVPAEQLDDTFLDYVCEVLLQGLAPRPLPEGGGRESG